MIDYASLRKRVGKVLVANRGEIACRVFRTLREAGIPSVAVYSEVDAQAPHVWLADEAVCIGEPRAYLDIDKILDVMKQCGATAVHPGYGFLAENPKFARACQKQGLVFIGPSPEAMEMFGDKREARFVAERAKVPVIPGAKSCDTPEEAAAAAQKLGLPVLLKAAAGGGGKGMRRVDDLASIPDALESASREATAAFNDGRMLVEKYIYPARHIEVQVLGDGKRAIALGERECSLQRRYQKVLEESPSGAIAPSLRQRLLDAAVSVVNEVGYSGAGTVEFLLGPGSPTDAEFYFLEVNTRLQVEHPVTELLTGLDLVAHQIDLAHGGELPPVPTPRGHAIEVRINAEDAYGGFLPASGDVLMLEWPERPGLRVDSGVAQGAGISPHYDSLIAKMIAWGSDREQARLRMIAALKETTILGLTTNQTFLLDVLGRDFFIEGETFTTTVESTEWEAPATPEIAQLAVDAASRNGTGGGAGGSGQHSGSGFSDRYSPWARLGAFRVGQ